MERFGIVSGLLAPLISLGAIALATLISPTFSWTQSALSSLGVAAPTAWLFNGGLIAGGVVSLPFGVRVFETARNLIERAGAVLFWLCAVALAAIGIFPAGTPLHFPSAIAFYLLLSLSLWTYGVGNAIAGAWLLGALTVLLGVLNIGAWFVWAMALQAIAPGLALPEIVGALILGVWIVGTTEIGRAHV